MRELEGSVRWDLKVKRASERGSVVDDDEGEEERRRRRSMSEVKWERLRLKISIGTCMGSSGEERLKSNVSE